MVVRLLIVLVIAVLAGCAQHPQPAPNGPPVVEIPAPSPPVVAEPEPEPAPPPTPVVETPPAPTEEPLAAPVAIVLSDRTPAFESVAATLTLLLDDYLLYNLADKSLAPPDVFASIEELQAEVVIAIGLGATQAAIAQSPVPVVFCQVFNVGSSRDAPVPVRGVASTPPLELQIGAWKQLNPKLKSIGAILGDGHDELISEATSATEAHGVTLHYRITNSDRETLFAFQRLAPTIDGFWLFPDNRVLSVEILQEMLDYATRHEVQVTVFNHALLQMGAALSSTTVETDIAETALSVATRLVRGEVDELPYITPLHEVRMRTAVPADVDVTSRGGSAGGKP